MTFQQFSVQLLIVTGLVVLAVFGLGTMLEQPPFDRLAIGMIIFFIILCPLLFLWAKSSAASSDKNAFSRMAMLSISLKMLLAVGIIVAYIEFVQPETKYFVVPFFFIYFGYTLFETYFLMKIGKEKPPSSIL